MRYGICINDGPQVMGSYEEIRGAVAGALLSVGYEGPPSAEERAREAMKWADREAQSGNTHGLALGFNGEIQV